MITPQDKELLRQKGISEEQIAEQLTCFEKGFPYLKLAAAASLEKGILAPAAEEQKLYLDAWDAYTRTDKVVVKFVPASGAASRMFKNLFEFLGADYDVPETKFEKTFFEQIEKFAFYNDLNAACLDNTGKNIDALVAEHNYKAVVSNLLEGAGLNYGALPKGLLKFHMIELVWIWIIFQSDILAGCFHKQKNHIFFVSDNLVCDARYAKTIYA